MTLVLAAHGSRDPRFAATARRVAAAARRALPGTRVELAYLDLTEPLLDDVLDALAVQGAADVTVVPLLFGDGFHSRTDLPALLCGARLRNPGLHVHQTPVIGRYSPVPALIDRLTEATTTPSALVEHTPISLVEPDANAASIGVETTPISLVEPDANAVSIGVETNPLEPTAATKGTGVLLYAVGSSDPASDASVREHGHELSGVLGVPVQTVFATRLGTGGSVIREAVARLTARGATRIAAVPLFLSAGVLTERVERELDRIAPGSLVAGPIADHPALIDAIVHLYRDSSRVRSPQPVY